MFTAEFDSEIILKIGQHLPKLWAIKYRVVFFTKHVYRLYGARQPRLYDVHTEWPVAFWGNSCSLQTCFSCMSYLPYLQEDFIGAGTSADNK